MENGLCLLRPWELMPAPSVAVIGAGAAGLVAAAFAATTAARVTLFERTKDGGRKILISGGGRCNVLPSILAPIGSSPTRRPTSCAECCAHGRCTNSARFSRTSCRFRSRSKRNPASSSRDRTRRKTSAMRSSCSRDPGVSRSGSRRPSRPRAVCRRLCNPDREAICKSIASSSRPAACPCPLPVATASASTSRGGTNHRIIDTYPALTPLLGSDRRMREPGRRVAERETARKIGSLARCSLGGGGSAETFGGFLFTHRGYSGPASSTSRTLHHAEAARHPVIRAQWSTARRRRLGAGARPGCLSKSGSVVPPSLRDISPPASPNT